MFDVDDIHTQEVTSVDCIMEEIVFKIHNLEGSNYVTSHTYTTLTL